MIQINNQMNAIYTIIYSTLSPIFQTKFDAYMKLIHHFKYSIITSTTNKIQNIKSQFLNCTNLPTKQFLYIIVVSFTQSVNFLFFNRIS